MELDRELEQYLRLLLQGMGRTERLQALGLYATGLLLSGERKSIAPMAARLSASAAEADAMRQRLQQAVVVAKWEPRVLFARLAHHLNQELGDIEALIGDDTGIPRYGDHCVGTARQYSGTLGRVDRCQVIPSLHAAGPRGSFCVGARLYLPDKWTESPERMREAGVPDGVTFATKWELMLGLIDQATQNDEGNPHLGWDSLPFVGDAGYGDVSELRRELNVRGRPYLLEVMLTTSVWPPGTEPESREGLRGNGDLHARCITTERTVLSAWPSLCSVKRGMHSRTSLGATETVRSDEDNSVQCACSRPVVTKRECLLNPSSGCCGSGPREPSCRRTTGSVRCPPIRRLSDLCTWPSCAGASSGTTKK